MKIYLAARYSRRLELAEYAAALSALGHEVTSTWLKGQDACYEEAGAIKTGVPDHLRQRWAVQDMEDLCRANLLIAFTEPEHTLKAGRGGRHVEFGIAVATQKRVLVVGPAENVFHCLPQVQRFDTFTEAVRAL